MAKMIGYANRWKDFPDYILSVTREIWEDRGIGTLHDSYAPQIPVRTPMGLSMGNKGVIAATMATCHEFPDRQLYGEDVIWSEHETGHLSSHRILTTGTHSREGVFGPATGRKFRIRVIADCAARGGVIFDEWLVRDYGGIVRQLGMEPRAYAAGLIEAEGGPETAARPFAPAMDVDGGYRGRGNDNAWGQRYADTLHRIMKADFTHIHDSYDRAVIGEYPGAQTTLGVEDVTAFWLGLRSAFPDAVFEIHHVIGMAGGIMPPRAAVRWSLTGTHSGWGSFGRPSGAPVHVMGLAHAEFGPFGPEGVGLRREFALYDEVAIWKQILLHLG
jgi:predicted ester cyclase